MSHQMLQLPPPILYFRYAVLLATPTIWIRPPLEYEIAIEPVMGPPKFSQLFHPKPSQRLHHT
jgi:hypothetical protein